MDSIYKTHGVLQQENLLPKAEKLAYTTDKYYTQQHCFITKILVMWTAVLLFVT